MRRLGFAGLALVLAHVEKLVKDTRGWQRIAEESRLPAGARLLQVGPMFQGDGTVCLDDARVEIVAPAGPPV